MASLSRIASLLIPVAIASLAQAQEPTAPQSLPTDTPKVNFADVDKNADGSLSKQEALTSADLDASFELLDTDRNLSLSPSEFARWSLAGKTAREVPSDATTAPGGSAGAQHVPEQ